MKTATAMFAAFAFVAALASGSAFAADKQLTPQQERMKTCNADAKTKNLAGAERKTFMSSCLKGESPATAAAAAPAKPMTQQEKMKACNADPKAKTLHGDERKTFMSSCLKGDAAAAAPAH